MRKYLEIFVLLTLFSMCLFISGWYAREMFIPDRKETEGISKGAQKCNDVEMYTDDEGNLKIRCFDYKIK